MDDNDDELRYTPILIDLKDYADDLPVPPHGDGVNVTIDGPGLYDPAVGWRARLGRWLRWHLYRFRCWLALHGFAVGVAVLWAAILAAALFLGGCGSDDAGLCREDPTGWVLSCPSGEVPACGPVACRDGRPVPEVVKDDDDLPILPRCVGELDLVPPGESLAGPDPWCLSTRSSVDGTELRRQWPVECIPDPCR